MILYIKKFNDLEESCSLQPGFEAALFRVGDLRGVGELRGRKKHVSFSDQRSPRKSLHKRAAAKEVRGWLLGRARKKGFKMLT